MNYKAIITTAVAVVSLFAVNANGQDQGGAIAVASQDGPAAVSVPVDNFVSATSKVEENLSKLKLSIGYDAEKKAIIQIGTAYLATKNPAGDNTFMIKRSAKAMEAYLNAKAEIIRSFAMEFSAEDRISTVAEFGETAEEVELAGKIDAVKTRLAIFAEKVGRPELASANVDDKLAATLKGLELGSATPPTDTITAKDVNFTDADGNNLKADKVSVTHKPAPSAQNRLAAERNELVKEIEEISATVKKINSKPVNSSTSKVELMSTMPLLGATVLTQAESWDKTEGIYEIAMAVLWSPKLQEEGKNLAKGTPEPSVKKGKYSAQEWIARQDLLAMAGPRRFTDKNGNAIVIGIAARDITGIPVVKLKAAKQLADTDAMRYVATSLMCDLYTARSAEQALQEFGDDTSKATESITDDIASKTSLNLSGVMRLSSKTGIHPITGRKIYATAYYLDPNLSKDAMDRIKQLYADAITVTDANNYKRGQLVGAEAKYEEAKASTEKFEEGKAEAAADVAGRVRAQEVKAKVTGAQGSSKQLGTQKGGAVSGDNLDDVDLDF